MSTEVVTQIGTVEYIFPRVYGANNQTLTVQPGTYPVVKDAAGMIFFELMGMPTDTVRPEFERVKGLSSTFMVKPGFDALIADAKPVAFNSRKWSQEDFAEWMRDETCTPGSGRRMIIQLW